MRSGRPRAGAAILGLDTHAKSVEIRRHLGYIPGDLALYPNLTGRDTLTYFANLRGGVDWSYVNELAERLDADLSRKVGNLSSGNRQKVGVIQAFMNRPDVLIMDEPSSGLDPLIQREFQNMVREVAADGPDRVPLQPHAIGGAAGRRTGRHHPPRSASPSPSSPSPISGRKQCGKSSWSWTRQRRRPYSRPCRERATRRLSTTTFSLSFDGDMGVLLQAASEHHTIVDITTNEADLEEIFLTYYHDEEVTD